jgi:urea transporter
MSFGIYIAGYIILIIGLALGAHLLQVPQKWIGVGVVCLVGMAIIHAVTATRHKDPVP